MDVVTLLEWQLRPTWTSVWSKPAFKISCKPIDSQVLTAVSLLTLFSFSLFVRYYGVVQLIPIFQYSNMYAATPKLRELPMNSDLSRECIAFVAKSSEKKGIYQVSCYHLIHFSS